MAEFWTVASAVFVGQLGVVIAVRLHQRRQARRMWRLLAARYPVTLSWLYPETATSKKRERR